MVVSRVNQSRAFRCCHCNKPTSLLFCFVEFLYLASMIGAQVSDLRTKRRYATKSGNIAILASRLHITTH